MYSKALNLEKACAPSAGGVRSAPPGGPPADASAVRPRDAREERGTTRWHDGVVTARDEVAGETPGALRAEAVAPREARAAEAVGVAIANRHAKEEAQGLKRGALSGGASKRGKKSPGSGRHGITQERIDAEKKAGKKFGFCQCGKEGPLGGQHNVTVAGKSKYCGKYKPK